MPPHSSQPDLDALGVLAEPLRRALYQYVVHERRDVSRNDAAEAVGVQRNLAAFHLDKLVDAGLLVATFRRLTTRTGPGAGRPAKLYRRAGVDHTVSLPPRAYPVAAELLAEVVDEVGADAALQAAAMRAGRTVGRRAALAATAPPDGEPAGAAYASPIPEHDSVTADSSSHTVGTTDTVGISDTAVDGPGRAAEDTCAALARRIEAVLGEHGFEPFTDDDKIRLHNCPFHLLSRQFPPLICGMNLALVEGMVNGLGGPDGLAHLDPAPDRCCVAVHRSMPPR